MKEKWELHKKEILWIIAILNFYPTILSWGLSLTLTNDLEKKKKHEKRKLSDLPIVLTTKAIVSFPLQIVNKGQVRW